MAVITGSAPGKHRPDRVIGCSRSRRRRAEIGVIQLPLRILARPPPRHSAQCDRSFRPGRAVKGAQIGDHLFRFAMPERAESAANLLKGEAVAHGAVLFHIDRLEPYAIGGGRVAVLAGQRVAKSLIRLHRLRHAGNAAGAGKMQPVRELQTAVLGGVLVE